MNEDNEASAAAAGPLPRPPVRLSNLGLRLVSALLLAMVTLAALFAGFPYWPLLVLLIAMGLAWEWNRMLSRSGGPVALGLLVVLAVVIGLAAFGLTAGAVVLSIVATCGLAASGTSEGRLTHAAGLLYFGLPSVALVWFAADTPHGGMAILFVLVVVWVTDSAAYFVGRSIGGARLWPSVSPNKTWSGSIGGCIGAAIAGVAFAWVIGAGPLAWISFLSLALSISCQAGDLLESALKRRHDRKDSSGLIPGHGGLMDRLDGLLIAVLVAAAIGLWWAPGHPSSAVLPGLVP